MRRARLGLQVWRLTLLPVVAFAFMVATIAIILGAVAGGLIALSGRLESEMYDLTGWIDKQWAKKGQLT